MNGMRFGNTSFRPIGFGEIDFLKNLLVMLFLIFIELISYGSGNSPPCREMSFKSGQSEHAYARSG
jgi:hypothetical protein